MCEKCIEYFDPEYGGKFDLSDFLVGMARYYRDRQVRDELHENKVWMHTPRKFQCDFVTDNFHVIFPNIDTLQISRSQLVHTITAGADKLTSLEVETFLNLRRRVEPNRGALAFHPDDEGKLNLANLVDTILEDQEPARKLVCENSQMVSPVSTLGSPSKLKIIDPIASPSDILRSNA